MTLLRHDSQIITPQAYLRLRGFAFVDIANETIDHPADLVHALTWPMVEAKWP
jgi:hypothetical protein